MEEKAVSSLSNYGPIGIAAAIFLLGVIALWRHSIKREEKIAAEREAMVKEREGWEAERARVAKEGEIAEMRIRGESVKAIADLQAMHSEQIIKIGNAALDREDKIRGEFADLMEQVANKATEQSVALTAVLQKFYERFVGPRGRY